MPQALRRRSDPQRAGGRCLILLRDYDPKRLRTVWRRVALRDEVREFVPGSALSASSAAGVWPEPSADSVLRMVAARLGPTAPSTRYTNNHLLFNS